MSDVHRPKQFWCHYAAMGRFRVAKSRFEVNLLMVIKLF